MVTKFLAEPVVVGQGAGFKREEDCKTLAQAAQKGLYGWKHSRLGWMGP